MATLEFYRSGHKTNLTSLPLKISVLLNDHPAHPALLNSLTLQMHNSATLHVIKQYLCTGGIATLLPGNEAFLPYHKGNMG